MIKMNSNEGIVNKVLFIAHDDKFIKHFLVDHKKTFESLGFDVIYATNNKYGSFDNCSDSNVFNIDIQQSPFKFIRNFKALKQVVSYISTNNINVIYAHTPVGGIIGRLTKLFSKNIKVIYLPHGYHFLKGSSVTSWLFYYPIEKIMSYLTDILITINNEDYDLTRRKMNKKMRVELINGVGVTLDNKTLSPNIREVDELFNITQIAELNDNKNQHSLLKAIKIISTKKNSDNCRL